MASPPPIPFDLAVRPGDDWFFAGLASSYPNITDSTKPYFKLSWPQPLPCRDSSSSPSEAAAPGCKVFHPPSTNLPTTSSTIVKEIDMDSAVGEDAWLMREQVMVFRYKGKFHAVDHACPHRTYSLSWGQPFDIEDAGRVLGVGIRCKGHSYAFELTTGEGDRGNYKLGVWEVDLRPLASTVGADRDGDHSSGGGSGTVESEEDREVWVRRKKRREM